MTTRWTGVRVRMLSLLSSSVILLLDYNGILSETQKFWTLYTWGFSLFATLLCRWPEFLMYIYVGRWVIWFLICRATRFLYLISYLDLFYYSMCRIRFPYPFQWGRPTVNVSDVVVMTAAAFVSLIEVCAFFRKNF